MPVVSKILCPTDFSEPSYEGSKIATELALSFSAELCLVHVIPPSRAASANRDRAGKPISHLALQRRARRAFGKMIEEQIPDSLVGEVMVVSGSAADRIVSVAEKKEVNLIVMATHGQTGWRSSHYGSVAKQVVRRASCPVLTVQTPQNRPRTRAALGHRG